MRSISTKAVFISLVGCGSLERDGACEYSKREVVGGSRFANVYRCIWMETERECATAQYDEHYYHADESCGDLGYIDPNPDDSNGHFESPSGPETPGANGAWGSGATSNGSASSSVGSTPYTFSCDVGGSNTVDIPNDGCQSESKRYAEVFGCNYMDDFYSACVDYLGCYGEDTSQCDSFRY